MAYSKKSSLSVLEVVLMLRTLIRVVPPQTCKQMSISTCLAPQAYIYECHQSGATLRPAHSGGAKLQPAYFTCCSILLDFSLRSEERPKRDVFLEKHWRSAISRSVCDYYLEAQRASPNDVPPVLAAPHHYLISIQRGGVALVAVCKQEVAPLFVIEFLHRVVDTFQDYFSDCTETIIKENYVVVYELLDEMLDNGFPLATESNILKELIKPPNILRTIANTVTGKSNVSSILPSGQLSNVPWRRSGVKYANNEAYFDVIEEVDAIIDKSGATVSAEIQGYIDCCIKLSGMPDLTLTFVNPRLFDDVSFHPCVRFKRWEAERILSFIPPDGNFRLMSYHIGSQSLVAIPIYVRHSLTLRSSGEQGRMDLTVGPKQTMGRTLEKYKDHSGRPKNYKDAELEELLKEDLSQTQKELALTLEVTQQAVSHRLKSLEMIHKHGNWVPYEISRDMLNTDYAGSSEKLFEKTRLGITIPPAIFTRHCAVRLSSVPVNGTCSVKAAVSVVSGADTSGANPSINVHFSIHQLAVSGLRVSRLDMYGANYKPFKGVKYVTKGGKFHVRM
ncbi:AP-3 complex subunit mu-1 [Eumeta japonica]|uniref:AP-3 complex subunit mu-1 n=1 Tax=Eumeta variegata TaxID=151549 RepID=A0A4C1TC79_EUMVA|nr:AP-3 complex subunit mu-1 [Eumeta japonica]